MSIMYVGDLHVHVSDVSRVDQVAYRLGVSAVVQVGDFGYFWPNDSSIQKYFEKRARKGRLNFPWLFCDGNHDNFDKLNQRWEDAGRPDVVKLKENMFHVRRGGFVEIDGIGHVFCGGARSTDRQFRIGREDLPFLNERGYGYYTAKDIRWWPEEVPTRQELLKFYNAIQRHKPEVVVTHEAPLCVPVERVGRDSDPTAREFTILVNTSEHRPARWFFGHHHVLGSWNDVSDINFYGCGFGGQYHIWKTTKEDKSET